jgi:hypothetical protein
LFDPSPIQNANEKKDSDTDTDPDPLTVLYLKSIAQQLKDFNEKKHMSSLQQKNLLFLKLFTLNVFCFTIKRKLLDGLRQHICVMNPYLNPNLYLNPSLNPNPDDRARMNSTV